MMIRRSYQILLGALGLGMLSFGFLLTATFFFYQRPFSDPGIPTGPVGYYFVAFTGCALMGWGGGLIGAARAPEASRTVTTLTVWILAIMAVVRMAAWLVGDYTTWLGDFPRTEATVLLLTAFALIWLRPKSGTHDAQPETEPVPELEPDVAADGEPTGEESP